MNKSRILTLTLIFVSTGCAIASEQANALPEWIETEKIRAGYMFAERPDEVEHLARMAQSGINTIIPKAFLNQRTRVEQELEYIKIFAQRCKELNLRLFVGFNWQLSPMTWGGFYKPAVYSDGLTEPRMPCPRNRRFWENYIFDNFGKIARLDLDNDFTIDGIFLDGEYYGPLDTKPRIRHYDETCFCDDCYASFLFTKEYTPDELPTIHAGQRMDWLKSRNWLEDYYTFIEIEIQKLASEAYAYLRDLNSNMILGMYPSPREGRNRQPNIRKSIVKGFIEDDRPFIVFATDTYTGGGVMNRMVPLPEDWSFVTENPNIAIAPGFLLRLNSPEMLEKDLPKTLDIFDGYWLYQMPMLWRYPHEGPQVPAGDISDYWSTINDINTAFSEKPLRSD